MCTVCVQAFGLRVWARRAFGEGCGFYDRCIALCYLDNFDNRFSYQSISFVGRRTSPTGIAAHCRRVWRYSKGTSIF